MKIQLKTNCSKKIKVMPYNYFGKISIANTLCENHLIRPFFFTLFSTFAAVSRISNILYGFQQLIRRWLFCIDK